MELMVEPTMEEPVIPTSTEDVVTKVKDKTSGEMISTMTTMNKESSVVQMKMAVHMILYKVWMEESRAWESNSTWLYNLILMHCPPNLKEVLKTMSSWKAVSEDQDAIGLLKMVHNVAHDQTEAKQMVMGFQGNK